jgi:hypothetical protein
VSDQLPPDVRHGLLLVALAVAATFCAVPIVEKWWRRSYAVLAFRAHARVLRQRLAYPFRLLRRQSPKTTAGAGASPTPAPAVPHDVEVPRDADQ